MKKNVLAFLVMMFCLSALGAEHVKFSVDGTERCYNQLRIVNCTGQEFDCTAYVLEKRGESFIASAPLGVFHLKNGNEYDSCTKLIYKGTNIGIDIPESAGQVSYVVSYKDYPLFDIIEVSLFDGESLLGKEF
ncbi:MAG: hypothetical protein IJ828_03325 [Treponema sp.]|nr:hypothetical protein [Treponema sp.]